MRVCTRTWSLPTVVTVDLAQVGDAGVRHRVLHVGDGGVGDGGLDLEVRAALELDAPLEAADPDGEEGDRDQDRRDDVPAAAAADEVVGDLAGVELVTDVTELGHLDPLALGRRAGRAGGTSGRRLLVPGRASTPR